MSSTIVPDYDQQSIDPDLPGYSRCREFDRSDRREETMLRRLKQQKTLCDAARCCASRSNTRAILWGIVLFLTVSMSFNNGLRAQDRFPINCNDTRAGTKVECGFRSCDQVFLISSRDMADRNCPIDNLKVWRAVGKEWVKTDVQHLLDSEFCEAKRETVVFVHGNLTNFNYCQIRGFQSYQSLFANAKTAPPTRFIIWAWPSEICGKHRYRSGLSFRKADVHAFFLGRLLFRFEPGTPMSIVGYSYGSRVVLGALHLAGGGTIDGHGIDRNNRCQLSPFTVSLVAPGIRGDCLEPCGIRSEAIKLVDRLLIIHNPSDPVLKMFQAAPVTSYQRVMGRRGITNPEKVPGYYQKVSEVNARKEIGHRHALSHYMQWPNIIREVQKNLFDY